MLFFVPLMSIEISTLKLLVSLWSALTLKITCREPGLRAHEWKDVDIHQIYTEEFLDFITFHPPIIIAKYIISSNIVYYKSITRGKFKFPSQVVLHIFVVKITKLRSPGISCLFQIWMVNPSLSVRCGSYHLLHFPVNLSFWCLTQCPGTFHHHDSAVIFW